MRKSFLIARSNLRRAKGQTVTIAALILLSSCMLNLWLMLATDYKQNFDRYHEKLNAEHVTLVLTGEDEEMREFVAGILEADSRTRQYSIEDAMAMVGAFTYGGGEINSEFVILEKQAAMNRTLGMVEIVEEGEDASGIYIPMLYGMGDGHKLGEMMEITIGSEALEYKVCGFSNSIMAGSHNCSMALLLFTEDQYRKLEESGAAPRAILVSVRLWDKNEGEDFEAMLKNAVSAQYPQARTLSNSYHDVSTSRYISQMICSGILSAAAFLVLMIALVVIASNVVDYIQENMKKLGALKAVGYTSGQLLLALQVQFVGIAAITSAAGAALSYGLFPSVNEMMISQTGIPYLMQFLPLPFLVTVCLENGAVALAVRISSRRIGKIEPIVALRQGMPTHSFRRNHVPLSGTRFPLHIALALKTTLGGLKQNIIICITMLVLSLVVVFAGVMAENIIVDTQPFIDLIVGETADACINVNTEREADFLQLVGEDERVQKVYLYNSVEVRHVGGIALIATMSEDFSQINNPDVCYAGRFPRYDNEIAVAAKYAREKGLKIGDEITLTAGGGEAAFIISGFTQISNNLGKDCLLTRSGYERMDSLMHESYYINLADGVDIDAFNDDIGSRLGDGVNAVINIRSVIEGTSRVYISMMKYIIAVVLILSVVVVALVLFLLVRTMLGNKKLDYGILKALGFTTGQLILQTGVSFMPAVILSTAVGLTVSAFVINPLIALFLSGIGIVKCRFAVPVGFVAAAGCGLVLFAFAVSCLLSLKIREIAPRNLLVGE